MKCWELLVLARTVLATSQIAVPGERQSDITECIAKIVDSNDFAVSTVALHAKSLVLALRNASVMRFGEDFQVENAFNFRIEAYVVVVDDLWRLEVVLKRLSHGQFLDYDQKYIIVLDAGGPRIDDVVRLLWRFDVVKFVLIAAGSVYKFSSNCESMTKLEVLCDSKDLFAVDLGKCKLRVRTAIWPPFVEDSAAKIPGTAHDYVMGGGLDVVLMDTVAERLGVEAVWSMSGTPNEWNDDFVDDNDDNNFHLLYVRKVDIIINSAIPTISRNKYFFMTPHYYYDSDGFCVPSAGVKPQHTKWLDSLEIYIYVFGSMLLFVPLLYYFEDRKRTVGQAFLDCVSVSSGLSSSYVPKTSKARSILMLWITFTFLMNMFYQTQLISVMYQPLYEPQVATDEDLAASPLRLLFLDHYRRYFANKNSSASKEIVRRMEKCPNIDECLKNVTEDRTSAVCIQLTFINYRLGLYLDDVGKPKLYCFKESVNSSPLIVLINRNFRHLRRLVFYLQACRDMGLMDKWSKDYFEDVRKQTGKVKDPAAFSPLRLRNLAIIFCIYLMGIGTSVIAFLCEILVCSSMAPWKKIA